MEALSADNVHTDQRLPVWEFVLFSLLWADKG